MRESWHLKYPKKYIKSATKVSPSLTYESINGSEMFFGNDLAV